MPATSHVLPFPSGAPAVDKARDRTGVQYIGIACELKATPASGYSRGSWGNAKTFEFGHKKMGKETPGIISNGVFWKPGQLSFKHTK